MWMRTGWHWSNVNTGYTTTASCVWTPTAANTYSLVVWARVVGHTANYDQCASLGYQVTIPPLTAVALAVTPTAPRPCNTPITLTATPTGGGGQVQYLFRAGYVDATGWHWSNVNTGYTTTASCVWTPTAANTYSLVVWARVVGHTTNYDQFASLGYQVTIPPLTAVALAVTPAAPRPCNTPITLTATPTGGGGQVQYLFRIGYVDTAGWHWSNVNTGYTTFSELHLDANDRQYLFAGGVGTRRGAYCQLRSVCLALLSGDDSAVNRGGVQCDSHRAAAVQHADYPDGDSHRRWRAGTISLPRRLYGRHGLALDECDWLHHVGNLHLDAIGRQHLFTGSMGAHCRA